MEDHVELLERVREIVGSYADQVFREMERETSEYSSELRDLVYIARDFTLRGGKRLRAFLVLLGYWSREWGLEIDDIKHLLVAIEFLQSYLLVHDDIMDRDTMRRGGPTVHVWFNDKCLDEKLLGDCQHYGISQAIIVGDYLESLAIHMFSKLDLPSNTLIRLIRTYTRGLRIVSYGQYLDVLMAVKPLEQVREEDVLLIHRLKTASYTVELPLHLGAIASNRYSDELLNELTSYAIPAGIAFQLKDDILGLYGDPSVTGKPVGSDVREKKKTLLIIYAYNHASEEDRLFLREVYDLKKPEEITVEDIYRVQEIVRSTGGLEYVNRIMEEYVEEARKALRDAVLINGNAKNVMEWLLKLFIEREK